MSSPTDPQNPDQPLDSLLDALPDSLLSDRDRRILEFERSWSSHAGAKEEAIRAEFALSAARYYQLLNAVIDLPGAVRADPMLIKRLQRARDERSQMRAARAFRNPGPGADSHPLSPETND